jgi:hypothetical protein
MHWDIGGERGDSKRFLSNLGPLKDQPLSAQAQAGMQGPHQSGAQQQAVNVMSGQGFSQPGGALPNVTGANGAINPNAMGNTMGGMLRATQTQPITQMTPQGQYESPSAYLARVGQFVSYAQGVNAQATGNENAAYQELQSNADKAHATAQDMVHNTIMSGRGDSNFVRAALNAGIFRNNGELSAAMDQLSNYTGGIESAQQHIISQREFQHNQFKTQAINRIASGDGSITNDWVDAQQRAGAFHESEAAEVKAKIAEYQDATKNGLAAIANTTSPEKAAAYPWKSIQEKKDAATTAFNYFSRMSPQSKVGANGQPITNDDFVKQQLNATGVVPEQYINSLSEAVNGKDRNPEASAAALRNAAALQKINPQVFSNNTSFNDQVSEFRRVTGDNVGQTGGITDKAAAETIIDANDPAKQKEIAEKMKPGGVLATALEGVEKMSGADMIQRASYTDKGMMSAVAGVVLMNKNIGSQSMNRSPFWNAIYGAYSPDLAERDQSKDDSVKQIGLSAYKASLQRNGRPDLADKAMRDAINRTVGPSGFGGVGMLAGALTRESDFVNPIEKVVGPVTFPGITDESERNSAVQAATMDQLRSWIGKNGSGIDVSNLNQSDIVLSHADGKPDFMHPENNKWVVSVANKSGQFVPVTPKSGMFSFDQNKALDFYVKSGMKSRLESNHPQTYADMSQNMP